MTTALLLILSVCCIAQSFLLWQEHRARRQVPVVTLGCLVCGEQRTYEMADPLCETAVQVFSEKHGLGECRRRP